MKNYPLEIENVGNHTYILMSKGHHDFELFKKAIVGDGYGGWGLGEPKHMWCKTVPCKTGEYECFYVFVEQGTRGSWPATYAWE